MIRPPSSQAEFEQLLNYFWDRLTIEMTSTARAPDGISLAKPAAYQARKALQHVHSNEELVSWVTQWLDAEAWQRARTHIRSRRYRERNQLVRATMKHETKNLLDARAKALGMPLWEYLESLGLTTETLLALELSKSATDTTDAG